MSASNYIENITDEFANQFKQDFANRVRVIINEHKKKIEEEIEVEADKIAAKYSYKILSHFSMEQVGNILRIEIKKGE